MNRRLSRVNSGCPPESRNGCRTSLPRYGDVGSIVPSDGPRIRRSIASSRRVGNGRRPVPTPGAELFGEPRRRRRLVLNQGPPRARVYGPSPLAPMCRAVRPTPRASSTSSGTPRSFPLRRVVQGLPYRILAKLEYLNPGGSVKDRIGPAMVDSMERSGQLKPGGTIVEATSGNTGVGLAMVAAVRGYRVVFVLPDKMSTEKIRLLRAYGARVVVTPSGLPPDHPMSHYSVARRLTQEIPGACYPNQYREPGKPGRPLPLHGPGDRAGRRPGPRGGGRDRRDGRDAERRRSVLQGAPTRR